MEFLHLGIVKGKNETFVAVLLKNWNLFIYGEFYKKNYKPIFFKQLPVSTCPEMLLMELPIMTRKWTCIFVLNFKLSAVNTQAIWMPKH